MKKIITVLKSALLFIINLRDVLDEIKINQGIILSNLYKNKDSTNIQDYEFKIFSQAGEDGILQHIIDTIEIKNKTFIEFGVEDFNGSNCRFLMKQGNWSGFVIDNSKKNINKLKNYNYFWKYNLKAVCEFINKDNVENVLLESGFDRDLGILSIDIDGNDYFILENINYFRPRILICEYNALFGHERKISIPYQSDFNMTKAHYSNLYWGASLSAITYCANKKGYALVGTNSNGVNAFYVRKDLLNEKLISLNTRDAFTECKMQISRDKNNDLSFLSTDEKFSLIKGMDVYDVEKGTLEKI